MQAWEYAADCQREAWDFAIEIQSLQQQGLTNNDLRWLLCKGLAKHRRENTKPADPERSFHAGPYLTFTNRSCFVLTATGLKAARQMDQERWGIFPPPGGDARPKRARMGKTDAPHWDSCRRELRWGNQLVKQFRLPAPNQEIILTAFEEEGWPARMDDPLPRQPNQDPKQRLHDTIKNLNRHQVRQLLVFHGDGTGEGIQWRNLLRAFPRACPEQPLIRRSTV